MQLLNKHRIIYVNKDESTETADKMSYETSSFIWSSTIGHWLFMYAVCRILSAHYSKMPQISMSKINMNS